MFSVCLPKDFLHALYLNYAFDFFQTKRGLSERKSSDSSDQSDSLCCCVNQSEFRKNIGGKPSAVGILSVRINDDWEYSPFMLHYFSFIRVPK